MILTRLGNKKSLSGDIWKYFPKHRMKIIPFFGAGGIYFNTPKAKYNVLNDLDDDVTNLYLVVQNQKDELAEAVKKMPISQTLVKHWRKNTETDPIKKAIRFLLLSNFTYLGKGDTLRIGVNNTKNALLEKIDPTFKALGNSCITNLDFRKVLKTISFSPTVLKKEDAFMYLDPVYLGTEHYYKVPKWTDEDTFDCFEMMDNSGIKCAMSEFDHPFVMSEAEKRNFVITPIKNRRNIKNTRKEILITNYRPQGLLF